ncbi:MAG: ATP-binding protein [Spirochaetales bacterium]|jgi:predicted AAA+ superfamily ATPase|nr:ATP-binding protein [Spirochaetales bacterium]
MESVETIVKEYQARPLPDVTRRDLKLELKGSLATAIIGMRRSGKTWRLFQEMRGFVEKGVNPQHILYINFDDGRFPHGADAGEALLDEVLETFFRLNPSARKSRAYFFFDEIQEIPDWARFTRRLIDTEKVKLYVSGSSAKLLSTEIATEFQCRSLGFELLPFSFREYLRHLRIAEKPSVLERSEYEHAFSEYLTVGGFPEAFTQTEAFIRTGLLRSYVDIVVFRDVLERYNLSNVRAVKELAYTLLAANANLVSMKRLTDQLSARGLTISREMTAQVCAHFEDAFLVFFAPLYSYSLQKSRVNPQKVYAADPGLAFALSASASPNLGQRFENAVYLELRRRFPLLKDHGISYYLTQERKEVDFILGDPAQKLPEALFQVCVSLKDKETRTRETSALTAAMEELGLTTGTIITLYERERIKTPSGIINVRPAWEWFLEA